MAKYFNTTGPCFPRLHYMLPPKDRLVGASLDRYIRDELYWVLHAPRQTGKTTFLQSWMHEINAGTEAVACYVSLETCQEVTEVERAMPAMATAVQQHAERFHVPAPDYPSEVSPENMLSALLIDWACWTPDNPADHASRPERPRQETCLCHDRQSRSVAGGES
ncbi:MAG: hypothetical protein Q3M30_04210 [Candidatus Electrothrix sp. Rat3]|nr:hypothetical protein [Candidatus Electrothrix rattekaaiensis]